jgi:Fe-S oxidoreductase
MAGSFGFEREKYDVSMAIGERALLPAVRDTDDGTLILADGYSCREQVWQATGRKPVHLSQVLRMAMTGG